VKAPNYILSQLGEDFKKQNVKEFKIQNDNKINESKVSSKGGDLEGADTN
jgi:hypothetical protein